MSMSKLRTSRGYTLIELVVAVGLFALVMTLASGSYLLMVDLTRQAQGISTGINNLSFVLETMTRSIRTGTSYNCGAFGVDCLDGEDSFSFRDSNGTDITYAQGAQGPDGSIGTIVKNGTIILTDPAISVSSLMFYVSGTGTITSGDFAQPYVTISISGTVSSGPRKKPQVFAIQTGATMRGIDLTVTTAPSIILPKPTCTLSTDTPSVLSGGVPNLSWINTNAHSFSIDQGIGSVSPASQGGPLPVATGISVTTIYTGTVKNSAGDSATCNVTVTVTS